MLLSEVIGQEGVKRRLLQSAANGRVAHAMLFAGPEGCGHLPMALAFAQFLSCENRRPEDSCGKCAACIKYSKLIHPDLHFSFPTSVVKSRKARSDEFLADWRKAVVENPYLGLFDWYEAIGIENKQGFMSVEESASIQHRLSLKAYESGYKVMIIWMADKMRADASNKLLKLLEEPPEHTLFMLVTEDPDALLNTMLSRTQLVKLNRIPDEVMQKAVQERFGIPYHEARHIVRLAEGNVNLARALAAHDTVQIDLEKEFMDWMRRCYALSSPKNREGHYRQLVLWIDTMGRSGRERQKNFLHYGLEVIRECMLHNYADATMVRMSDAVLPGFSRFAPFIHTENADLFENELSKAFFHIERNANPRILFLDLSFRINALLHLSRNKG